MTRNEAQQIINEIPGRLCARIYLRKDGSVMTSDCGMALKGLHRQIIKRIAGLTVLLLSLFGLGRFVVDLKYGNANDDSYRRAYLTGQMPVVQGKALQDQNEEELIGLGYISE